MDDKYRIFVFTCFGAMFAAFLRLLFEPRDALFTCYHADYCLVDSIRVVLSCPRACSIFSIFYSRTLWGPLFERGFTTQHDFTLQLINLSVPRPGLAWLRRDESKKPVGESFLWSVMAASPMYDPPTSPDAPRVVVGSRPELTMAQLRASGAPTGNPERL